MIAVRIARVAGFVAFVAAGSAFLVLWLLIMTWQPPAESATVTDRCWEDEPCWVPQWMGNGKGRLDVFDTPFVSLKR